MDSAKHVGKYSTVAAGGRREVPLFNFNRKSSQITVTQEPNLLLQHFSAG